MATKRKRQTKKTATPNKKRVADPPVSLHPMKFSEAISALLSHKPSKADR